MHRKKSHPITLKNSRIRVILVVTYCFVLYLILSVGSKILNYRWEPFDKINLLTEVFPVKAQVTPQHFAQPPKKDHFNQSPQQDFNLYKKGEFITNFYTDNQPALPKLMEKLDRLKKGDTAKIRIAYFGDSMIEGDLLTQTLRKLLQQEYGGNGVGYIPINCETAKLRQTATTIADGWQDLNFKTNNVRNTYLSGHLFTGMGKGKYIDNTIPPEQLKNNQLQKSIIFGNTSGVITANGKQIELIAKEKVNRQVLASDHSNQLHIETSENSPTLYGVSFESQNGVFVDNFSFRGITGVELNKIDQDFLQAIQKSNHYDLIVFQYGVNLMFKPNDTDYTYYSKMINPVFKKFKNVFSDSEFLLIGSGDRAFRYDGTYKTAIGLPHLLELQAQLAMENGFAFYNQFASMGGENTIVKWAEQSPALANKDYIHPNAKGTDLLAEKLFQSIQRDYKNYLKKINSNGARS